MSRKKIRLNPLASFNDSASSDAVVPEPQAEVPDEKSPEKSGGSNKPKGSSFPLYF